MKPKFYVPFLLFVCAIWLGAQNNKTVQSVFGRTGNVAALAGDYTFAKISGQITPAQMPTNWWLLIPPSTFCTSCPNITTPGSLQTGVGFNVPSTITLWDGTSQAPTIRPGTGVPTHVAPPGSIYIRTDTGSWYQRSTSGTWIQK